jgi:lactoylglutathione lyase
MSGNRLFHHVNILVDDLDLAVKFYRDDLGLEPDTTPDQDFPTQFFKLGDSGQIHINEYADERPYRAHFAIRVDDFSAVFRHMKEIGAIDIKPWGNVRKLPGGAMQMFLRDPSANLVEITSHPDDQIDSDVMEDDLVDQGETLYVSGRGESRRGV